MYYELSRSTGQWSKWQGDITYQHQKTL